MIYKQVTLSSFRDAFSYTYKNNFSYEGLEVLFEYLNELGQDVELDVVDIACSYAEETYEEVLEEHYAGDVDEDEGEGEALKVRARYVIEHERGSTIIGETPGGFVYSVY